MRAAQPPSPAQVENRSVDDRFRAAKAMAKGLATKFSASTHLADARAFCFAMLDAHWRARCQEAGCKWQISKGPLSKGPTDEGSAQLAELLGRTAASFHPNRAAYLLGTVYTAMLPSGVRSDSQEEREAWCAYMLSNKKKDTPPGAWFAGNSREQVRDEGLQKGLIQVGAVHERPNVPTTSSKPKYALDPGFAGLFNQELSGDELGQAIEAWQAANLNKAALARLVLAKNHAAASAAQGRVLVAQPDGNTLTLAPGDSSHIAKEVIERFSKLFLRDPALLWISESARKVVDPALASKLGLKIDPSKHLPDVILVDVGGPEALLVFVEVVHSDGPIDERRKTALEDLAKEAGFDPKHLAFVTAFSDRGSPAYKKLAPDLAWGSFVWFASEPDCVVQLTRGSERKLRELR